MKDPHGIVQRMLVTEKGTTLQQKHNQYLFRVHPAANKLEIKRAVEQLFKVKVTRVNTMVRAGKNKRLRSMNYGMTSDWKRAVVTLKEGDKIDLT
jgi:large subunit ribosomal protein L23